MEEIGFGLIGTGFMGKAHALAYGAARAVMGPDVPPVRLAVLCDPDAARAAALADQWGFARHEADWRALIADPEVRIVSIATPNALHREMALAALEAGKHVHCEKPLALSVEEAAEMAAAAERTGARTLVGYNYIRNPAFAHARQLIGAGEIGRVVHFRGWVDEDYQADAALPWSWRSRLAEAGLGALGDLGCHLVSMAWELCGPIDSLIADTQIIHETRPLADGSGRAKVENEDTATALVRFASGARGSLSCSRAAWGRKNRLAWEVHGTRGMIIFDQERMNELRLFRQGRDEGFQTILTGPDHAPYEAFCPAPGHQLGFNDLKVIEAAEFLRHIAGGPAPRPDFRTALAWERVIHAMARPAAPGTWTRIEGEDKA